MGDSDDDTCNLCGDETGEGLFIHLQSKHDYSEHGARLVASYVFTSPDQAEVIKPPQA